MDWTFEDRCPRLFNQNKPVEKEMVIPIIQKVKTKAKLKLKQGMSLLAQKGKKWYFIEKRGNLIHNILS